VIRAWRDARADGVDDFDGSARRRDRGHRRGLRRDHFRSRGGDAGRRQNIAGETRVLTTAIVLNTRQGEFGLALALGIISAGADVWGECIVAKTPGKEK